MREICASRRTCEAGSSEISVELEVPVDLPCFAGHFPGRPILPGYVLFDWALERALEEWCLEGGPLQARSLKFFSPVLPGDRLKLISSFERGMVSYTYERRGERVAVGSFSLGVPE